MSASSDNEEGVEALPLTRLLDENLHPLPIHGYALDPFSFRRRSHQLVFRLRRIPDMRDVIKFIYIR